MADVKDTVHKASLMLHLVELVIEKFPKSSDLYADLPHVHWVAKVSTEVGERQLPRHTCLLLSFAMESEVGAE